MLDDPGTLHARDAHGLLDALARFPGRPPAADRRHDAPVAFEATGPAAVLVGVVAPWTDARVAEGGTLVLVDGGFAGDDVAAAAVAAEAVGAHVVRVGADDDGDAVARAFGVAGVGPDLVLEDGPLAALELVRVLAHATGRADALAAFDDALTAVATACAPTVPTEANPAKGLAWRLYRRVPLLVTGRGGGALQGWVQQVFARVGKTLAVPAGEHPALLAATAFEARHALGDDLVALVLGAEDAETALVAEVLGSRVAQVERLAPGADGWPGGVGEPVLDAALVAFAATWVAAYGALLGELDPGSAGVYDAVRRAATGGRGGVER